MNWKESRNDPLCRTEISDTWKTDWDIPKEFYCSRREEIERCEIWKVDYFFSEMKENMHNFSKATLWVEEGGYNLVCIKKHSNKTRYKDKIKI